MGTADDRHRLERLGAVLCSTADRRQARAGELAALAAAVPPDRFVTWAGDLRVLGIAGGRLEAFGLASPQLVRDVADAVAAAGTQVQLCGSVQRAACARLEAAGIPALALKGADLAARLHPRVGTRPCADADLLVAPEDVDAAIEVLAVLGFAVEGPRTEVLHHVLLAHRAGTLPDIELHWRVEGFSKDLATTVLRRSLPPADGDGRRARDADELALLLLIYARDGMVGLRLPADVAAWWGRYGADLPPGAVGQVARSTPAVRRALTSAALACHRLVGLPAPEVLGLRPDEGLRARLAARLADPFAARQTRRGDGRAALVEGLLTPASAARRFAARHVLPPAEVLTPWYGAPRLSRALRPPLLALAVVRAAAHLARRPARRGRGSRGR